jgi:hypothetical protein
VEVGDEAAPDDADADCHAGPPVEPISSFRSVICLDYCLAPFNDARAFLMRPA